MERRSTAALTGAGLHTGSSGVAATASRSTARKTGTGKPSSILREWRSRTWSGMKTRTAPGSGTPRSLHMRLEKGERSAVFPRRTMPTVFPPGSSTAASRGSDRYQRNRTGYSTAAIAAASR